MRLMHDKTLYFADGSFVLSASGDVDDVTESTDVIEGLEDTNNKDILIYFRVHQSLLSRESTVFADMFMVGSASATDELYDGVPLITVQDKAKDLRGFLKTIYEPFEIFLPRYSFNSAKLLTGPLLLAVKYQADAIKRRIIAHLQLDWPHDDYEEWGRRKTMLEAHPDPEQLTHLARVTNLTAELKDTMGVAYYAILSYPIPTWCSDILEAHDFITLVDGRNKVNSWLWAWINTEGPKDPGVPKGPTLSLPCATCKLVEGRFREKILLRWMKDSLKSCDVIDFLQKEANVLRVVIADSELCLICRNEGAGWLREMAKSFYQRLGELFTDVPPVALSMAVA